MSMINTRSRFNPSLQDREDQRHGRQSSPTSGQRERETRQLTEALRTEPRVNTGRTQATDFYRLRDFYSDTFTVSVADEFLERRKREREEALANQRRHEDLQYQQNQKYFPFPIRTRYRYPFEYDYENRERREKEAALMNMYGGSSLKRDEEYAKEFKKWNLNINRIKVISRALAPTREIANQKMMAEMYKEMGFSGFWARRFDPKFLADELFPRNNSNHHALDILTENNTRHMAAHYYGEND